MTLIKRTPSRTSFNGLLDSFFTDDFNPWTGVRTNTYLPAVNIKENENEFNLSVQAPGFSKENFKVELDKDRLTISAEVHEEHQEDKGNYSRKEFSTANFTRSFILGENLVNGDSIEAKYENGILTVHLPKKEEAKPQPVKLIDIK